MNKLSPLLLGLSLAVAGGLSAAAQEMSSETPSIPKVLQITREFIKAGKSGAPHDKTESVFVQAMARTKWPTHYIALSSLSGKSRALYLTGYPSFEAWEKDNAAMAKHTALSAELDRASVADGELLDSIDQEVFYYDDELSYRASPDISSARFFEISVFHVRPGHRKEWEEVAKMAIAAHQKAGTSAHWAMFELVYGGEGGTYALLSADKSMAEIDTGFKEDKQFIEAMGEDGMKKFSELYGAAVDNSHQELFSINPRQSYAPEEWIKSDPDFWKPKVAATPAVKPAAAEKKANP